MTTNQTSKFEVLSERGNVVNTVWFIEFDRDWGRGRAKAFARARALADGWEQKARHITGATTIREA